VEKLIYAALISFAVTIGLGLIVIPILKKMKFGQNIRDDGPQTHLKKAGTPTMGGLFFIPAIIAAVLLLAEGSLDFPLVCLLTMLGFGAIGFADDMIKIRQKRSLGLKAYQKIIGQLGLSLILALYAYNHPDIGSAIKIPFTQGEWDMGIFYVPIMVLVIIYMVNSVNLTDGLDGLVSGVTLVSSLALGSAAMVLWQMSDSEGLAYLASNYQNIMICAGAGAGACMGFLRYNAHPAKVFMGDTGSMALGGLIMSVSLLTRLPLYLPFFGGIYIVESMSVILQVISYKTTGKRIFRMSPIHHHYELKGMPEVKIVTMFVVACVLLGMVGLLAL